ncbi:YciI family protein [Wenzhouxiangella sediminis]|uniref:YCII-related domain-containing protein n=1 Tax=Wenzhouxiangella sediminis TaxID=1792836 RepID=A0A3E1KAK4_9GAMM|nr:YciI family protein [Wenzhouxiangella sediminis]RFF31382.1 hypothetical protein DZC52_04795 [Wenzhouxiangella sediminis]
MSRTIPIALNALIFLVVVAFAPDAQGRGGDATQPEAAFDARLAEELGADAYGMRRYVMVLLKSGDNRDHAPERVAELQRGHLDNMQRLAEEGVLVLAGPFLDGGDRRGIFVFAVNTIEEAKDLTASDPAIQAGRLEAEYWPWYGSAALLQLGDIHERIARENP